MFEDQETRVSLTENKASVLAAGSEGSGGPGSSQNSGLDFFF